jgi:hypothetical protein
MYIITHLYVVKDFWSFEILKQFWNMFWTFKVFEFHIKNLWIFFNVVNMFLSFIFFQWKFFYFMSPFDSPLQNWLHVTDVHFQTS